MHSGMRCVIVEDWDDILSLFSEEQQDVYYTKKYVGLYESSEKKALCIVCYESDKILLMPYLRGRVQNYYDFETAYGYGGPISNTDDIEWCKIAFHRIHDYLLENKYVCGFMRFHPLLSNEMFVVEDTECIQVIYDRHTIAIDTFQNEEDIWKNQISSKNRNMIRKAEKNCLEYKTEYDFASYEEFIALYRSTMKRLSADEFYFFNDKYFCNLRRNLSDCSFLGTVRKDGKLICAAIFLYSKSYGHYHLEGGDREYASLGANNLLLWKSACEMHKLGIKEFHLGGGTTASPEDSLYKFKKAFSKNEKCFYIGKEIFDITAYNNICFEWSVQNQDKVPVYGNRLLKYRY